MVEANFNIKGDLIGLSAEVAMLASEVITLDDGSQRAYNDGTTFLTVDTGDLYILYKQKWYKL